MKQLTDRLRAPIGSLDDACNFIDELVRLGLDWHFDDDAVDCLHETNIHLTRADAELLGRQRDDLYRFNWGKAECPIGYCLHAHAVLADGNAEWTLPDDWKAAA